MRDPLGKAAPILKPYDPSQEISQMGQMKVSELLRKEKEEKESQAKTEEDLYNLNKLTKDFWDKDANRIQSKRQEVEKIYLETINKYGGYSKVPQAAWRIVREEVDGLVDLANMSVQQKSMYGKAIEMMYGDKEGLLDKDDLIGQLNEFAGMPIEERPKFMFDPKSTIKFDPVKYAKDISSGLDPTSFTGGQMNVGGKEFLVEGTETRPREEYYKLGELLYNAQTATGKQLRQTTTLEDFQKNLYTFAKQGKKSSKKISGDGGTGSGEVDESELNQTPNERINYFKYKNNKTEYPYKSYDFEVGSIYGKEGLRNPGSFTVWTNESEKPSTKTQEMVYKPANVAVMMFTKKKTKKKNGEWVAANTMVLSGNEDAYEPGDVEYRVMLKGNYFVGTDQYTSIEPLDNNTIDWLMKNAKQQSSPQKKLNKLSVQIGNAQNYANQLNGTTTTTTTPTNTNWNKYKR